MIYRQGRNYENLNKMIYRGTGKFDTPRLVPEACNADSFIGFNYAKSCKDPQRKGVHFFIDDYQFTRRSHGVTRAVLTGALMVSL